MATRFLKLAALYWLIGVCVGLGMGITQEFRLAPVHAHLNLLGWASLALVALIYQAHPPAATTRLARWHFWLHNLGLPVFMVHLALLLSGQGWARAGVAVGASATVVGVLLFVINLHLTVRSDRRDVQPAGARGES